MRVKPPMCLHQIQPWGKATPAPSSSHSANRVALHCYLCVWSGGETCRRTAEALGWQKGRGRGNNADKQKQKDRARVRERIRDAENV